MAADDDDFVRQLASAQLADDVVGLRVGIEVRLHRELHADCGRRDPASRWKRSASSAGIAAAGIFGASSA